MSAGCWFSVSIIIPSFRYGRCQFYIGGVPGGLYIGVEEGFSGLPAEIAFALEPPAPSPVPSESVQEEPGRFLLPDPAHSAQVGPSRFEAVNAPGVVLAAHGGSRSSSLGYWLGLPVLDPGVFPQSVFPVKGLVACSASAYGLERASKAAQVWSSGRGGAVSELYLVATCTVPGRVSREVKALFKLVGGAFSEAFLVPFSEECYSVASVEGLAAPKKVLKIKHLIERKNK